MTSDVVGASNVQVKTGAGMLKRLIPQATGAYQFTVHDGTSAAGRVIACGSSGSALALPVEVHEAFNTGLYVEGNAALAHLVVIYE